MILPINQIAQGHALEVLQKFPSESVDMVITSPPYKSSGVGIEGLRQQATGMGWGFQVQTSLERT